MCFDRAWMGVVGGSLAGMGGRTLHDDDNDDDNDDYDEDNDDDDDNDDDNDDNDNDDHLDGEGDIDDDDFCAIALLGGLVRSSTPWRKRWIQSFRCQLHVKRR